MANDTPNTKMMIGPGGGEPPVEREESISITISSPQNNATLSEPSNGLPITVSGTVQLYLYRLGPIRIQVQGRVEPVTQVTPVVGGKCSWTKQVYITKPGKIPINASVVDATNQGYSEKTVEVNVVDNNPPYQLEITGPPNNSEINLPLGVFTITVSGSAKDYLGIKDVIVERWFNGAMIETNKKNYDPEGNPADVYWSIPLDIKEDQIGRHTVKARAFDTSLKVTADREISLTTKDVTPPDCTIVSPLNRDKINFSADSPPEVRVSGNAKDSQSGVSFVECKLDEGIFQRATTYDEWNNWSLVIKNIGIGKRKLTLRFQDKAGNTDSKFIDIEVGQLYKAKDVADLVSPRAYLESLLKFAVKQVKAPKEDLTPQQLEQIFLQPFSRLINPSEEWGNYQVNQVRACINLLRRYIPANGLTLLAHWKLDEVGGTLAADSSGNGNDAILMPFPKAALLAHWKFDEGTGSAVADASGNGNNGTLVNGPLWGVGKTGNSLGFDGVDDYVNVNSSPKIEVGKNGSDFSLAFWMQLSKGFDNVNFRSIMTKSANVTTPQTGVSSAFLLWMRPESNRIHYRISTTSSLNEGGDSKSAIPLNTWTHVAYVKFGSKLQLYINGALDSEIQILGKTISNSGPVMMGGGVNSFAGRLDDVRIYGGALASSDVNGLVSLVGGPNWSSAGKIKGCLSFDGVDDYAYVNNTPLLGEMGQGNSDFSLAFWIFLKEGFNGKFRDIINKRRPGSNDRTFSLFMRPNDNRVHYRISTISDWNEGGDSVSSVPLNAWTHIAYVKVGGKLQLYINGTLDSEVQLKDTVLNNPGPILMGGNGSFNGSLDDVRIYKGPLSSGEAAVLYQKLDLKGLLAHWKLDEASGMVAADASGNANTGMLVSAVAPTARLLAHWKFDEMGGIIVNDSSGNGNTGSLSGPPYWDGAGMFSGCLSFPGTTSNVLVNPTPVLDGIGNNNTDFSVSFWIFPREGPIGVPRSIMHKGNQDGERILAFWMNPNNNGILYRINTTENPDLGLNSATQLQQYAWNHIAFVKNGNKLQLYINGLLDSELPITGSVVGNNGPFYIGKDPWYRGANCKIDDIRIYEGALSALHVGYMLPSNRPPLWRSDGKIGGSLSFDGIDDHVLVNPTPLLNGIGKNNTDFSVSFWMFLKQDRNGYFRSIIRKAASDGNRTFSLFLNPDSNSIHFRISTTFNSNEGGNTLSQIPPGVWTHIAYVKNGSKLQLYINGLLDSEVTLKGTVVSNDGPMYIGKDPWTRGTNCQMDDIRIYETALSPPSLAVLSAGFDLKAAYSTELKAAETEYLQTAYSTILNRIGTSYEEMRLIRGEDEVERKRIASSLGIDPSRLDRLDALFIGPDVITEAKLESLFGLANTSREPWTAKYEIDFLDWQLDYLKTQWTQQDFPEQNYQDFEKAETDRVPIVEPDIINEKDIAYQDQDNAVLKMLKARASWIGTQLNNLKGQRQSAPTAIAGLTKIINSTIVIPQGLTSLCSASQGQPIQFLQCLLGKMKEGNDIEPTLDKLYLTMESFSYLLRIKTLAEKSGIVTESEWADAYDILLYIKKRQSYGAWRREEKEKNVSLNPETFRISTLPQSINKWRATAQMRKKWQDTLKARIDRVSSTLQALQGNIQAVEEKSLPILRDGLLAAISMDQPLSETKDRLSEHLLIDMKSGAAQYTTYVRQAIETLQGILFSLRTKSFAQIHPAYTWVFQFLVPEPQIDPNRPPTNDEMFDESWKWQGDYNAWIAAKLVYNFPENILLPDLRENMQKIKSEKVQQIKQTKEFTDWIKEMNNYGQYLSPLKAREQADAYLKNVFNNNTLLQPNNTTVGKKVMELLKNPGQQDFIITEEDLTDSKLAYLRQKNRDLLDPARVQDNREVLPYINEIFYFVPVQIALQLQRSGQYVAALDWYQLVYAYNLPVSERPIYYKLQVEKNTPPVISDSNWLFYLNPHDVAEDRPNPYTRFTLMSLVRCFLEFADYEFTRNSPASISKARTLYMIAKNLLLTAGSQLDSPAGSSSVSLPNPLLDALRARADSQLSKIRQGRNISGMKIQSESPAINLKTMEKYLPTFGSSSSSSSGQPFVPRAAVLLPTPYRFSVLIERSKHLVTIAQQVESSYLYALEKYDGENYNILQARQAVETSKAGVELQKLRQSEAQTNIVLADTQLTRIDKIKETYSEYIAKDLNPYEKELIDNYWNSRLQKKFASRADMTTQLAQLGIQAAMLSKPQGGIDGLVFGAAGAIAAGLFAATATGSIIAKESYNEKIIDLEASAQITSIRANHERQRDQLRMQLEISNHDRAVSEQQKKVAEAQKEIVDKESSISSITQTHNEAMVEFLATKFTSAKLYGYVINVLSGVYRYFLQQATSMAQLAQNQLEFERQERAPNFILDDYWQQTSSSSSSSFSEPRPSPSNKTEDMRGITGSSRLLQDIYKLDQFAFEKNKRKLNLVQTFSLAQLFPMVFQQFREKGVMEFGIPMYYFDRRFPGHYLRLIKRIRTSVVALVPSAHGISATLSSYGISRVVVKNGDTFQTVDITREPEAVALTSPTNATGVFEMDEQSELLNAFESHGVDAMWQFEMPKAANQFDYNTISDVMITMEYTALQDLGYRQQIIKSMDNEIGGDRQLSFKEQFPDQWYELQNSEQVEDSQKQMRVRFSVQRQDFPPNIDNLHLKDILLYVARANGKSFEVNATLAKRNDSTILSGGQAVSLDGIINTARGNWSPLLNANSGENSLVGEWELSFVTDDPVKYKEVVDRFKNGDIEDVIIILTYQGNTPEWPNI